MESAKKKRVNNFDVAAHIVETYGHDVPDEKIIKVAKLFNLNPNILIKNYKTVSGLKQIFEEFPPEKS